MGIVVAFLSSRVRHSAKPIPPAKEVCIVCCALVSAPCVMVRDGMIVTTKSSEECETLRAVNSLGW